MKTKHTLEYWNYLHVLVNEIKPAISELKKELRPQGFSFSAKEDCRLLRDDNGKPLPSPQYSLTVKYPSKKEVVIVFGLVNKDVLFTELDVLYNSQRLVVNQVTKDRAKEMLQEILKLNTNNETNDN